MGQKTCRVIDSLLACRRAYEPIVQVGEDANAFVLQRRKRWISIAMHLVKFEQESEWEHTELIRPALEREAENLSVAGRYRHMKISIFEVDAGDQSPSETT